MLSSALITVFFFIIFYREKMPLQFRGYLPYLVAIVVTILSVTFPITWTQVYPSLLMAFLLSFNSEKLKNEKVLYPLLFVPILPDSETHYPLLLAFSFLLINYLTKFKRAPRLCGLIVLGLCLIVNVRGFEAGFPFIYFIFLLPIVLVLLSFNKLSQILIVCFLLSEKIFLTDHPDILFSIAMVILLGFFNAKKKDYKIISSLVLAFWVPVNDRAIFFIISVLSMDILSKFARLLFKSIHSLEISDDGKFLISKEHGLMGVLALWVFSGSQFSLGSYVYFLDVSYMWINLVSTTIILSVVILPMLRRSSWVKEVDPKLELLELFIKSTVLVAAMSFLLEKSSFVWGQALGGAALILICVLIKMEKLNLNKLNMFLCKTLLFVPQVNIGNEFPKVKSKVIQNVKTRQPDMTSERLRLTLGGLSPTFVFVFTTLLILIVYIEN